MERTNWRVAVVGGGGRVGLPFSLINTLVHNHTIIIDRDGARRATILRGEMPFIEDSGQEALEQALEMGMQVTGSPHIIQTCNVIAIMIGTPVDGEGNPRLDDIIGCVKHDVAPNLKKGTLVLLRSTVSPGTTDLVKNILEQETGLQESFDFTLVFAPERVAQGKGLVETRSLPQLIGSYTHQGFAHAANYFSSFSERDPISLTPREAELAKLMTNMYRYVNLALANEFYMIANNHGADAHKIIAAANKDYSRMDCPLPGPNVGGPCLFKDGKFLVSDVPYADLIKVSFDINEGMPEYLFKRAMAKKPDIKKFVIWGMAFKIDNDDTRSSLSFKFKKVCERHGKEVFCFDPLVYNHTDEEIARELSSGDCHVIMTPHSLFKNGRFLAHVQKGSLYVDAWRQTDGRFEEPSRDGFYHIHESV